MAHVNKLVRIVGLVFVLLLVASPVFAQTGNAAGVINSGAVGAGLVCIGSAYGIGKLASSAVESMARQPEVAGSIQTAMIIAAALIEGFTFYAIIVCGQQNPFPAVAH
jgi:F-type H+-transporting ATPase subunit c